MGAYFPFYWVFYDFGFNFDGLIGSGINYRNDWVDLSDERKTFFKDMCKANKMYLANNPNAKCE